MGGEAPTFPRRRPGVVDIDKQRCPHCSARELKIIAAILERPSTEKILNDLPWGGNCFERQRADRSG